jgi:hypothetical protein
MMILLYIQLPRIALSSQFLLLLLTVDVYSTRAETGKSYPNRNPDVPNRMTNKTCILIQTSRPAPSVPSTATGALAPQSLTQSNCTFLCASLTSDPSYSFTTILFQKPNILTFNSRGPTTQNAPPHHPAFHQSQSRPCSPSHFRQHRHCNRYPHSTTLRRGRAVTHSSKPSSPIALGPRNTCGSEIFTRQFTDHETSIESLYLNIGLLH